MPYKGVECQSLEKDLEDKPIKKENIFFCINWDKKNNCCKGVRDYLLNKKYIFVKINENDIDKDCKNNNGKSNPYKCVYFIADYSTGYIVRGE
jgi:hypothetical protein